MVIDSRRFIDRSINSSTITFDGTNTEDILSLSIVDNTSVNNNIISATGGNRSDLISLSLTAGESDSINNNNISLQGDGGFDVTSNVRDNVLNVSGGSGNDTIDVNLNGGETSDVVRNTVTIDGGQGTDLIQLDINGVLTGVDANDINIQYTDSGDLGDEIVGLDSSDTAVLDLEFSQTVFNGDADSDGNLDAGAFVLGSAAVDGDDYFIYDGSQLFYDADGNGAGSQQLVASFDSALPIDETNISFI